MTLQELKRANKSLGFEEESTMTEYQEIVIDAINHAMQVIFDDIVISLEGYYKRTLSTEEIPWEAVRPEKIDLNTPNEHLIDLPDNVLELVPLLASYHIWLDDDIQKATMYWNEYDDLRQKIMSACLSNVKAKIVGGIGW